MKYILYLMVMVSMLSAGCILVPEGGRDHYHDEHHDRDWDHDHDYDHGDHR